MPVLPSLGVEETYGQASGIPLPKDTLEEGKFYPLLLIYSLSNGSLYLRVHWFALPGRLWPPIASMRRPRSAICCLLALAAYLSGGLLRVRLGGQCLLMGGAAAWSCRGVVVLYLCRAIIVLGSRIGEWVLVGHYLPRALAGLGNSRAG